MSTKTCSKSVLYCEAIVSNAETRLRWEKMESCERRPEAKAVTQCHMNAMQSTLGG